MKFSAKIFSKIPLTSIYDPRSKGLKKLPSVVLETDDDKYPGYYCQSIEHDKTLPPWNSQINRSRCREFHHREAKSKQDWQPCGSGSFDKCDPSKPGRGCNCAITLTPLPEDATESKHTNTPKGMGYYALIDIQTGQLIAFYTGKITKTRPSNCTRTASWREFFINGENAGPHSCINHSCDPNCKFVEFPSKDGKNKKQDACVGIYAVKPIKKGDELTVDYGAGDKYQAAQRVEENLGMPCQCGAKDCRSKKS